ncbi:hypothetical protein [Synechococcus phage Ssp-JY42]|nr:hypothetical protein [Synechococcus phage Yong-M4-211]
MGHLPADGSQMFAKIIPPGPMDAQPHPFVRPSSHEMQQQIERIITDNICLIGVDDLLGDAAGQICVDGDSIKRIAGKIAALSHPEGQSALVEAARAMADDYQTSPKHHPQHVLVPLSAFEAMRAALAQPDPLTETSGRVDGSSVAASAGAGPDGPGACDAQRQSEGGAS